MAIRSSPGWMQSTDSDGFLKLPDSSMTPANSREPIDPDIPRIERLLEIFSFG
jgi:hypothetical protein